MDVRDGIIQRLREEGFWAKARDWAPGATIIVASSYSENEGGFKDYICLVPMPGRKWMIHFLGFAFEGDTCYSNDQVVNRIIEIYRMTPKERDAILKAWMKNSQGSSGWRPPESKKYPLP